MAVQAATRVSLEGEWRLDYFLQPDDGPVRELPVSVPVKTVRATVPGNCELDLVNAGVLPPPELGMNVLKRMARFLNRKSQRRYRLKFADSYYGEMAHYGLYRLATVKTRI